MGERFPEIDITATGENIKQLMKINKLGVFDMASRLKLRSTTNIYAWTQGRMVPSVDNLIKLAYLFNCTLDEIIVLKKESDK